MARKSRYESVIPPNMELIKKWLSQGVPEKDIAKNLGIGLTTWKRWKNETDEFRTVVVSERVPLVRELENTMFRLANGYTVTLTKVMKVRDPGGGEHLEEYEEEVHVPANFNALRFLLINWSNEYSNDPGLLKQRIAEFEHRKALDERDAW